MQVAIGEEGLTKSWQENYEKTTECGHCGNEARIGFVAYEGLQGKKLPKNPDEEHCRDLNGQVLICSLHPNDPKGDGYWLHDCCSVAVYFCRKGNKQRRGCYHAPLDLAIDKVGLSRACQPGRQLRC